MPPNEAKAQIRYACQVTGASILSMSVVTARPSTALWWVPVGWVSFSAAEAIFGNKLQVLRSCRAGRTCDLRKRIEGRKKDKTDEQENQKQKGGEQTGETSRII